MALAREQEAENDASILHLDIRGAGRGNCCWLEIVLAVAELREGMQKEGTASLQIIGPWACGELLIKNIPSHTFFEMLMPTL